MNKQLHIADEKNMKLRNNNTIVIGECKPLKCIINY